MAESQILNKPNPIQQFTDSNAVQLSLEFEGEVQNMEQDHSKVREIQQGQQDLIHVTDFYQTFVDYKPINATQVQCNNKEQLAASSSIIRPVLKELKDNIVQGKGIVNMSLPVKIFEGKSTLERMV